ncbi:MAG: hypothetical protein HY690_14715 [Chloroflexi bacterium]|nr:hypothetical protein [Chloroflexota bacterium]
MNRAEETMAEHAHLTHGAKKTTVRRSVQRDSPPSASAPHPLLQLQRQVGNQAVANMLAQREEEDEDEAPSASASAAAPAPRARGR